MSKMMKTAAVALVLAMVAFGPTAAIAAPHSSPIASGAHFGFIQVLMQILGLGPKTPVQAKPIAPAGGTVSTDGAIWGGGRCGVGGC